MRIAIISYFFTESTACLAKYIAKQGIEVDYYLKSNLLHEKGVYSGFEYKYSRKTPGISRLENDSIKEIIEYTEGLPVKYYVLHLISDLPKYDLINKCILRKSMSYLKRQKYDAINIVGQFPLIEYMHNCLKGENLIHTFHEIGSHQDGQRTTPIIDAAIRDSSKVIIHSASTAKRFLSLPDAKEENVRVIPFGKFETNLLYERDVNINVPLDLSKPTFLFYGYIQPYKGLDILCSAHKELGQCLDKFNLIIAGNGKDESLQYFHNQKNCFVINRFLSNDEMMKLNRMADVIVLPYHTASQSGIVPTSFLYNKPIIATAVGAFVETITDGVNGVLVEKDNPQAFALAMKTLFEAPHLIRKLSEGTKLFGNGDCFDWDIIARESLKFIKS